MMAIDTSKIASLRHKLAASDPPPYRFLDGREKAWQDSPAATEQSLNRFLRARKGDVQKTLIMVSDHLTWRRQCFPIHREGEVAKILDENQRFRIIGLNADGRKVHMMHHLWGYFYRGGCKPEDCLRAILWLIETELTISDAVGQPESIDVLLYGGPPPLDFSMALQMTLEANYPERLHRAVIYPVPAMVARFVRMMCWFLDKDTASKIYIEFSEQTCLDVLKLRVEQLPAFIQGGLDVVERQMEPDAKERMQSLIWNGINGGKKPAIAVMNNILRPFYDVVPATVDTPTSKSYFSSWMTCCCVREIVVSPRGKMSSQFHEASEVSDLEPETSSTSENREPNLYRILCGLVFLNLTFVLLLLSMAELWRCASVHGVCKPLTMSLFESMFGSSEELNEL